MTGMIAAISENGKLLFFFVSPLSTVPGADSRTRPGRPQPENELLLTDQPDIRDAPPESPGLIVDFMKK
jgi:hypothetical protein